MKRLALLLAVLVPLPLLAPAGQRDDQWKKVNESISKGLPKTAAEQLDPIITSAVKDKAWAEAIKAVALKISLEGNIQGNKPEEKLTRLKAAIATYPAEMTPVLEAIQANWYWHYFQQNRWRFLRRTATAQAPSDDITTWDLPRILAEVDRQFTRALSAEKILKAIPIAEYDALLEKGVAPDSYRPTLYDFLAFEALAFYTSGEQAGAKAEDAFELPASSPIFAPADEFLKWKVESSDENSLTVKAIRLYQALMRFHEKDRDRSAFLDADLHRLQFGWNKAFGEDKNTRYKAALRKFADTNQAHELSSRAIYLHAEVLRSEGDLVAARKLAIDGEKAHPNSVGARLSHNLIKSIEAPSASIVAERVWNDPWPEIRVNYRNLTRVYFRAVAYDYDERIKSAQYRPEYLTNTERTALLVRKPAREWSADLPVTKDYKLRTENVAVPRDLKPGFYFLVASHDPDFSTKNNQVTFTDFWVSNLALIIRARSGEGVLEGMVLDARTGEPMPNAEIKAWYRDWRNNARVAVQPTSTDANGLFRIQGINNHSYMVLARFKDQAVSSNNDYYIYQGGRGPGTFTQTVFFTDRSLYRPGQTIHYKGLCIQADQQNDRYSVLPAQELTVVFSDTNHKEIARQTVKTNDYGSFAGSFTAPSDRLLGQMTLHTQGGPHGYAYFRVEEYKRPKFQVTLDKPKVAAKLNATVSLQGKATAYTGAAIDGARVRYRVVREVRFPIWCYWYYRGWMPQRESQEIAHGWTTTAIDGTFKIEFLAKPDVTVPEKDEPTFRYAVHADVTDTTGETRSGSTAIHVGYTALQANLSAPQWLVKDKEIKVDVRTTTLDGEPQSAEGVVKIHRLKQPAKVHRALLQQPYYYREREDRREPDLSNPSSWELGEVAVEKKFKTDDKGQAVIATDLPAGAYRVHLETKDRFGKAVKALLPLTIVDPEARKLALKVPSLVIAKSWTVEPGNKFVALWGSGYDSSRAYVEIEHRGKLLQSFWTPAGRTQILIEQDVTEAMRGGFTLRVTQVKENRAYLTALHIDVPWSNKELKVRWENFRSKLEPGQKETWTLVITGPDAKRAVAEMVCALYDESLDAYLPHTWMSRLNVFRQDWSHVDSRFENANRSLQHLQGQWSISYKDANWSYRSFPHAIGRNYWGYEYFDGRGGFGGGAPQGAPKPTAPSKGQAGEEEKAKNDKSRGEPAEGGDPTGTGKTGPDVGQVSPRKNLNETAFFFPHILSDRDGEVRIQFTMPEALTRWKFLAFAHDKELRSGFLQDSIVTAKDLMVQPLPPRFVREGDILEFTVKVTNQSDKKQSGKVRLTFSDARTSKSVDSALSNTTLDQSFEIPAKESRSFAWKITVPDGMGFLIYKAVASAGKLSDGEEGYLPVLSKRILVTESMPLTIRGPVVRKIDFTRLTESAKSQTLSHKQVAVQVTSNPNWYAVMALPYLMEYPYQCSEQVFNRLYANALARHIANSDPRIRQIFDQWKGTKALDSPLEKNQDLKAVMLEETPWLRQAVKESEARRNVGILFDANRLNAEQTRALGQLAEAQYPDGAWPWFPGGPPNDFITLYITTGFGRMRHLGVQIDTTVAVKALNRLDRWVDQIYREIVKRGLKDKNNLSPTIALYLYGRSFFLKDKAVAKEHSEAMQYFLQQARTHWLKLSSRMSQAHLALALQRFDHKDAAQGILKSLKERSVTNEEMGMFWRDTELSWWWYRAPIETQALMIEAFDEVANDAQAVEECKIWLLRQKQTRDWKTTKATADAVYALLLRGSNPLSSDSLVEVALGGVTVKPEKVEAGTGFYEKRFLGDEIKPKLGEITVKKEDKGLAWGNVTWQYMEDVGKVTPHEGTPLKLKKTLYIKELTKKGPVLKPVSGALQVGDEVVMRIELRTDRDMEYVHLKDERGSGTEPVNVLSRYRYQDGLAYYESTRDTATHFFIDYLPKGTYVFEYSVRVVHKGQYQTGLASIQCMYAPEFNSHSQSIAMTVK